jgi:hypothetical protein
VNANKSGYALTGTLMLTDKHQIKKRALRGIVIAFLAAYIYAAWSVLQGNNSQPFSLFEVFVAPLFVVLLMVWLLIPLGAAAGVLIPKSLRYESRLRLVLFAIGFAIAIGITVTLALALVEAPEYTNAYVRANPNPWWTDLKRRMMLVFFRVTAYSVPWTIGYAYFTQRQEKKIENSDSTVILG